MSSVHLTSEAETLAFAARLAAHLEPGDVVGLEGPLGAGKTFLIRGAIYALGVPEEIAVPSPTFTLMQEYDGRAAILHADLYRLAEADELIELGLFEAMQNAVTFVEWGRRFDTLGREVALWITLAPVDDYARSATIEPASPRGETLVAKLSL